MICVWIEQLDSRWYGAALHERALVAAAAIPVGCAATYGSIAKAAHTDARTVGQVMAANPLYPVVPCHRVVGSDLSLVGNGGSRKPEALKAKLDRLRAEKRGRAGKSTLDALGGMEIVPVEWVIARAVKDGVSGSGQLPLW